jgi:GH24 family phage-related lysozyme (muramidase)
MRARQKVSRAGVELIKSFEGLRTAAARLPDGRWTLGYGHTFSAREGAKVTQEDADALLRFDLLPVVDSINNLILVPLNQNQFDALVSFCFNIGAENFAQSTVLKRINEGRFAEAALAMDSWRSAEFNGQTYVLAPLIRRRAAEKNLFLTPDEISHQATTLGRPVEDTPAPPVVAPDASYINPYATPAPAVTERQVIDLSAPTPPETVVENLPQGFVAASAMREAAPPPVPPVTPAYGNPYVSPPEPQMSAEAQAAIARAQDEQRWLEETQRLEAQRQVEALAVARAAEAARLRDDARVQEQQRLDAARLEQARIEAERAEAARLDAIHAAALRQEQTRLEQVHLEQARIEAERLEQAKLQAYRWEQERLEQERLERERLEAERVENERQRAEQMRLEQEKRVAEETVLQAPQANDEAEKARKAEAAAALMRLYSPYGGGNLGLPLAGPFAKSAPAAPPQPAPPANVISTPEPAAQPDLEFTNHSVISPSTVESTPFEISSRAEALSPEPESEPETVVDFSPAGSASTMPAPVITALNPYAKPIPVAAVAEALVEVPRPAPVDFSAPSNAPIAAEIGGLHWRDQLQRPLPQDYQAPQAARPEPEQPFLRAGPSSNFQTATYEDDTDTWMTNGDRIALSSEDAEAEADNLWQMIVKTLWWIIISAIGLGCLGIATGAWWQATHDQTVIRNGMVDSYTFISIGTAALGILFVSISVWLIMKRLGGLKD